VLVEVVQQVHLHLAHNLQTAQTLESFHRHHFLLYGHQVVAEVVVIPHLHTIEQCLVAQVAAVPAILKELVRLVILVGIHRQRGTQAVQLLVPHNMPLRVVVEPVAQEVLAAARQRVVMVA
jgi:hypothetical protein